jgi:hypothetical protein
MAGHWRNMDDANTDPVAGNLFDNPGWNAAAGDTFAFKWEWAVDSAYNGPYNHANDAGKQNGFFINYINPMFYRKMDCAAFNYDESHSLPKANLFAADTLHNTVLSLNTRIGVDVQVWDESNGAAIDFAMETGGGGLQKSGDYDAIMQVGFVRFEMLPVGHVIHNNMLCM